MEEQNVVHDAAELATIFNCYFRIIAGTMGAPDPADEDDDGIVLLERDKNNKRWIQRNGSREVQSPEKSLNLITLQRIMSYKD